MELLSKIGIDWKLLAAQIINFLVLLFVLYKFAYGPILKMLDERTKKIEKGLKDSEEAQKKLVEMEAKEKAVLLSAREEAQKIIQKSEATAVQNAKDIEISAKEQSAKILEDAKKQIEQEKNKAMQAVKMEIADLVMRATEKIIDEKMDSAKDKELIEKIIK
jgi:F-type H+-transporting ATPase subunit b